MRDEAAALRPLAGIPPFKITRDLLPRVGAECAVEVDGNAYSVPRRSLGGRMRAKAGADMVRVLHAGREVGVYVGLKDWHCQAVDDRHLAGIAGTEGQAGPGRRRGGRLATHRTAPTLLRPLSEYEAAIGGSF